MSGDVSREHVMKTLRYEPDTGLFYWIAQLDGKGHRRKMHEPAGGINSKGYRRIKLEGRDYLCSRLAFLVMTGEWPKGQVDHISGVRSDDKWSNLREVSHAENGRNQKRHSRNTSGASGISRAKRGKPWMAVIGSPKNGSYEYLGTFNTFDEALSARKTAERERGYHINHGRHSYSGANAL